MQVTENTRIRALLRRFPSTVDLFGWYGIEIEDFDSDTTVRDVAWEHRVELDDLVGDLQASVDDELRDRDPDEEEEFDEDEDGEYDDDDMDDNLSSDRSRRSLTSQDEGWGDLGSDSGFDEDDEDEDEEEEEEQVDFDEDDD